MMLLIINIIGKPRSRNTTFPSFINDLIIPTIIFVLYKHYCIPGVVWLPTNALNNVLLFLELVHGFIDGTCPAIPCPNMPPCAGVELVPPPILRPKPVYPLPGCCKGEP